MIWGENRLKVYVKTTIWARWRYRRTRHVHRERKCADTIGTVPVPSAGHLQRQMLIHFSNKIFGSNFIKQQSETGMV